MSAQSAAASESEPPAESGLLGGKSGYAKLVDFLTCMFPGTSLDSPRILNS